VNIITLTQPHATLVAIKAKQIETRSWATSYRGPVAIHAGAGLGPVGGIDGLAELVDEELFHEALEQFWKPGASWDSYALAQRLPRGVIVAVATLEMCHYTHLLPWRDGVFPVRFIQRNETISWLLTDQERAFGDYSPGRFAWFLSDVRPLRTPLPYRGAQGLRRLPDDAAAQVEALL
jgi:hypothetical protein